VNNDGALLVRGPLVGGRLHTRDRGHRDAKGWHIDGRLDDVLVVGGRKLEPAEVEAALRRHPAVAAAMVVGLADPQLGNYPAALLTAKPGAARPSPAELHDFCATRLAPWKIPELWQWVSELPLAGPGKPSRRLGRAWIEQQPSSPTTQKLRRPSAGVKETP